MIKNKYLILLLLCLSCGPDRVRLSGNADILIEQVMNATSTNTAQNSSGSSGSSSSVDTSKSTTTTGGSISIIKNFNFQILTSGEELMAATISEGALFYFAKQIISSSITRYSLKKYSFEENGSKLLCDILDDGSFEGLSGKSNGGLNSGLVIYGGKAFFSKGTGRQKLRVLRFSDCIFENEIDLTGATSSRDFTLFTKLSSAGIMCNTTNYQGLYSSIDYSDSSISTLKWSQISLGKMTFDGYERLKGAATDENNNLYIIDHSIIWKLKSNMSPIGWVEWDTNAYGFPDIIGFYKNSLYLLEKTSGSTPAYKLYVVDVSQF